VTEFRVLRMHLKPVQGSMQELGAGPLRAMVLWCQRAQSTVLQPSDEDVLAKWPICISKTAVKYWSWSVCRLHGITKVYFLFGGARA